MVNWLYVLTDLAGNVLGEITNPKERTCTLSLNRVDTASCQVPLWHPMGMMMADSTDKLLKVYRDYGTGYGAPLFVGPVLSSQETADQLQQNVGINAVSPFWILSKRLLGTDKIGIAFGTQAAPVEITSIAAAILTSCNAAEYTGIEQGTFTPSSPTNNTYVGPYHLQNAAEAIAQLTATVNGFDFKMRYIEPTYSAHLWPRIAYMDVGPLIGVQRPDAIFEYGGPRPNLAGYDRQVTRENYMTKGYTTAPSNEVAPYVKEDTAARAARGLFEDVVPDGGVNSDPVRDQLISEHLYYRKAPREIINLTVAMNASPTFGRDFTTGDFVRARATVRGVTRFDAMFRVWGVTFTVDANGNEKAELEIVMP